MNIERIIERVLNRAMNVFKVNIFQIPENYSNLICHYNKQFTFISLFSSISQPEH